MVIVRQAAKIIVLILIMQIDVEASDLVEEDLSSSVKAEYLVNLAKFTRWPEKAFLLKPESISICVYRHGYFMEFLKNVLGDRIHKRKLDIYVISAEEELSNCHILYVSQYDNKGYMRLINRINNSDRSKSILTISDKKGFVNDGGVIEFVKMRGGTRFILNLDRGKRLGLTFRPELIEVAEQVR